MVPRLSSRGCGKRAAYCQWWNHRTFVHAGRILYLYIGHLVITLFLYVTHGHINLKNLAICANYSGAWPWLLVAALYLGHGWWQFGGTWTLKFFYTYVTVFISWKLVKLKVLHSFGFTMFAQVCERSLSNTQNGPSMPPVQNFVRAEMLPSGYLIRPCEGGGSIIHIVDHMNLEVILFDICNT